MLIEVDNLRNSQKKFGSLYENVSTIEFNFRWLFYKKNSFWQITKQLSDSRAAQYALEEDVVHKEGAIGIDSVCHQLNNCSRGINYYGGIEKYNRSVGSGKDWVEASRYRVNKCVLQLFL